MGLLMLHSNYPVKEQFAPPLLIPSFSSSFSILTGFWASPVWSLGGLDNVAENEAPPPPRWEENKSGSVDRTLPTKSHNILETCLFFHNDYFILETGSFMMSVVVGIALFHLIYLSLHCSNSSFDNIALI